MISDLLDVCPACQARELRCAVFEHGGSTWWLVACKCRLKLLEVMGGTDAPDSVLRLRYPEGLH